MSGLLVIDIERCIGCKRCEIECAVAHSQSKDLFLAMDEDPAPEARVEVKSSDDFAARLQCRHCEEAPCIEACDKDALTRVGPGEPVLLDRELCIGCRKCIKVCPFGGVRVARAGKLVVKCDLCVERLARGEEPACVVACHVGAIRFTPAEEVTADGREKTCKYLVIPKVC